MDKDGIRSCDGCVAAGTCPDQVKGQVDSLRRQEETIGTIWRDGQAGTIHRSCDEQLAAAEQKLSAKKAQVEGEDGKRMGRVRRMLAALGGNGEGDRVGPQEKNQRPRDRYPELKPIK